MSNVTETHEEKETLSVDVNLPGHDPRVTTPLFAHTREKLIARDGCCFVCGITSGETSLEAHHHPVERSFAEMIDWSEGSQIRKDFPTFDWASFKSPYDFVDNMLFNGMLLCKAHHIGRDEGIHALPFPIFLAQRYGKEGYKFSDVEIIHHEQK